MGLFSIFEREDDKTECIELVSCPNAGINCAEHRRGINRSLMAARKSWINKEYQKSIDDLKDAYSCTGNLSKESCQVCSELFQSTIVNSLEQITIELENMSTGFFGKKRYKSSYLVAVETMDELVMCRQPEN